MAFKRLNQRIFLIMAQRLLALNRYDGAQACYVRVLNMQPEQAQLASAYAGLAQTEFHRCHFLNAKHYARQYLELVAADDAQRQTPAQKKVFEKISWYHAASQEEALNLRRRR